jgi:flagellar hook protein FlgE
MGIFDALTTAVSGLQAQSFALQNISGNIANSQTVGYKETDTSFQDLVSNAALNQQTAGGVFASSSSSNTVQGTLQAASSPTDMAIDGDGYFVVTQADNASGSATTFTGVQDYTRRGDFTLNSDGYLVNGAGYYLMGTPLDPATGEATTSTPTVLQFNSDFLPAQATTTINYQANLPETPSASAFDATAYSSASQPLDSGTGTVVANDNSVFTAQSVDGGSVTAYDSDGNSVNVQLRWMQTASGSSGTTWQLFYQTNSAATGTQAEWQNVGTSFTFNSSGALTSPASTSISISNLTVKGDNLGNVSLNYAPGGGTTGLTQYANSTGDAQVTGISQNGFAAGQMESLSVDSQGQIVGSFSNGQTVALADVTLATFNGEDQLQPLDGEAFAATPESGSPLLSATGKVVGSELESSNVDIATQFSQLIVAQQAYSANARVMTTADQMIQSLLTVIQ